MLRDTPVENRFRTAWVLSRIAVQRSYVGFRQLRALRSGCISDRDERTPLAALSPKGMPRWSSPAAMASSEAMRPEAA
jgi:hypothetical protein